MKHIAVLGLSGAALLACAPASATTLTFDTDFTGSAYSEAGMTIAATPASQVPVIVSGGVLGLPCCDYGDQLAQYELTTGSLFDLVSLFIVHQDDGEPVTIEGYLGGSLVASAILDGGLSGTNYAFTGFTGLDSVLISSNGFWNDPKYDDLVYQSVVPEPATWALMIGGFALAGAGLRRRRSAVGFA